MAHHKSTNPDEFILPDLGEGVHEAELIKWRVKVGDTIAEHDILAEMETDKALVEVPSPRAGTIASLNGNEGEVLKVGNILVTYQASGSALPLPEGGGRGVGLSSASASSSHSHTSSHSATAVAEPPEPSADREDAGTVVGKMGGELAGMSAAPGKALATPAVRRLARDLSLDIDSISGTGIGGRVTEKDVRAASSGAPASAPQRAPSVSAGSPPAPGRHAAPSMIPAPAAPAPRPAAPASADTNREE